MHAVLFFKVPQILLWFILLKLISGHWLISLAPSQETRSANTAVRAAGKEMKSYSSFIHISSFLSSGWPYHGISCPTGEETATWPKVSAEQDFRPGLYSLPLFPWHLLPACYSMCVTAGDGVQYWGTDLHPELQNGLPGYVVPKPAAEGQTYHLSHLGGWGRKIVS